MEDWLREPAVAIDEGVPETRAQAWVSTPASPRWLILVVGSHPKLARGLEHCGCTLRTVRDGASAIVALRQERPDGVILDLANVAAPVPPRSLRSLPPEGAGPAWERPGAGPVPPRSLRSLPPEGAGPAWERPGAGPDGVALLRRVRDIDATLPVVALVSPFAGHGALTADAIRAGAFVLASPASPEVVHAAFLRVLGEQRQADVLAYYRGREAKRAGLDQLVGECVPMLRLKTQLRLLLDAQARCGEAPAVLLQGDSGTGKEEVARALHVDGARRDCPFVRVDVDDMMAPEAEARLFGRERGADASPRRVGLVEAADGGTLFIDDLAALAPALQGRISRLLEHGTMQRVGGAREVQVDVHVVVATRCSAEALLRAGRLRPDLHRCLTHVLQLVPLRERGDDLWLLAHGFLEGAAERCGLTPPRLSSAARALLALHQWPGNVRELRHALERAVMLQPDGTIDSAHLPLAPAPRAAPPPPVLQEPPRSLRSLPPEGAGPAWERPVLSRVEGPGAGPELSLHRLEREALVQALQRAYGNVTQAARLLGISRDTMRYRVAKHALGAPRAMR
jgi:two-component system, NtrC family, response regulator AtoC